VDGWAYFVYKVVTVKHVDTIPGRVARNNNDSLIWAQPDNIFKRYLLIGLDAARATSTRNDLEINQVNVNWMAPTTTLVD
jgi:hypothetical protein